MVNIIPIAFSTNYFIVSKLFKRRSTEYHCNIAIFRNLIRHFDGIIARKMNISSVKLRRFDSQTDLIFWISAGIATYWLESKLIKQYTIEIIILFITEGLCYAISFSRFKKETCSHAFLSKVWGIRLLVAFVSLIGFSYGGFSLQLAIYWGLFSQLDVILIMLLLPKWQNDVPSAYHAYLIRKGIAFKKSKWLNDN